MIPNEYYTPEKAHYDVGLLKLAHNIEYDYNTAEKMGTIQRIPLARSSDTVKHDDSAYVAGWGKNVDNPDSDDLYQLDLKVVNSTHCAQMWGDSAYDYEQHHVCTMGKHGKDACAGLFLQSTSCLSIF